MHQFAEPTTLGNLPLDNGFFRAMLDQFAEGVIACDASGRIRYFNRAAAVLHGLDGPAIALGLWPSQYDLLHADGVSPYDADNFPLMRALRDGAVHDMKFAIRPRNGKPIVTVLARGQVLMHADGEVAGAMLIMSDISAQVEVGKQRFARIDAVVQASRQIFQVSSLGDAAGDLVDMSPQIAWKADANGAITHFTNYWYRLTNCRPDESLGSSYLSMVHPDDRERLKDAWNDASSRREPLEVELRLMSAAEQEFKWFLVRGVPRFDYAGSIDHWVGTAIDITLCKNSEMALFEHVRMLEELHHVSASVASELRLEPLMQVVTDAAVGVTGAQFGAFFHTVSSAEGHDYSLYAVSGLPRAAFAQVAGEGSNGILSPEFAASGIRRSDDISADAALSRDIPNGLPPLRSYLAVPVYGSAGEVYGAIVLGHALAGRFSERHSRMVESIAMQASVGIVNSRLYEMRESLLESERIARAAAERESRLKEEFLSAVSHELRTPLNSIIGWSTILARSHHGDPLLAKAIAVIERNAKAQARLVDDLLAMGGIIAGKMPLRMSHVDLLRLVREAAESLRPLTESLGVRVVLQMKLQEAIVFADPLRMHQVIWNLLSNALKFSQAGAAVTVSVARESERFALRVADTGRGIAPEFMPYLFDRFRQEDGSIARKHGGLGLGLAIAKALVEQHGGAISAHSEGIGSGAEFTVLLPESDGSEVAEADNEVDVDGGEALELDLAGIRVLVVDDDDAMQAHLREALIQAGAQVTVAASVRTALDMLAREVPEILLSDIAMPVEDGFDLIRKVRALEKQQGIARLPAIALFDLPAAQDRARIFRAGFNASVTKPVDTAELVAVIASLTLK
ncbi:hybrid sensor histidine kinase/response regulator [Noviherbaspirillum pedocola]|uniref:histidine kinase n=1 Tax=Noviherbaspirillum pedocola TaxID=2801341 RepID=A0A934W8S6_9BURK|nr:ATP-binding protein [Noviherbaspirillum pedocola]MBK4736179.1 PAS domain-containing protein [Noviherbaspirillum pedocola]